jgi:hypothetical protein
MLHKAVSPAWLTSRQTDKKVVKIFLQDVDPSLGNDNASLYEHKPCTLFSLEQTSLTDPDTRPHTESVVLNDFYSKTRLEKVLSSTSCIYLVTNNFLPAPPLWFIK